MRNYWVHEIQFLRGLAILIIVLTHVAGDFRHVFVVNGDAVVRVLFCVLTRFGVPLFIVISGFVLYNRYGASTSWRDFYSRRFKKVLVPYSIFSLIYLGYAGWENGWFPSFGKCLWAVLTGTSYYHLRFVRLIIQLYLLYPFLARFYCWFEYKGRARQLLWGAMFFQTLTIVGLKLLKGRHADTGLLDLLLTFMEFIFYFFLGFWAARNRRKLSITTDLFVQRYAFSLAMVFAFAVYAHASVLLSNLGQYRSPEAAHGMDGIAIVLTRVVTDVISLVMSYQGARFLMQRPNIVASFVLRIGMLSYGIYLLHPLMLSLMGLSLRRGFSLVDMGAISIPTLFVLTLVSTYAVVALIYRTPFSESLLGRAESKKSLPGD